jgi:signal peptide peptidase SppA
MIIPIEGTMMRAPSSFGGTSTVQLRRIIRNAKNNTEIKAIMFAVDSPGGTVAGTDELAQEIKSFAQVKTIRSHVDGLMASAAFWVGSQVSMITASRTSEIGSLGTVAVVRDFSENLEKQGIKTHVISTGPHKGAFTPGAEVTEEQLADLQSIVDKLNGFFKEAVMDGRGLDAKTVNKLFDGRVHVAEDAKKLGLIDGITDFESAVRSLEKEVFLEDDSDSALARARATRLR